MSEDKKLDDIIKERLSSLPSPVRDAIKSADVEKGLRELADKHKLHLDQWQTLENEVMLTLIGLQPVNKLEENIMNEVNVDAETAQSLASDIAMVVFEPIRAELERELGKPATEEEKISAVEDAHIETPAQKIIVNAPPVSIEPKAPPIPAPVASTPPAAAPTAKSVRATLSPAYAPETKSHERKTIDDDPYREPIA